MSLEVAAVGKRFVRADGAPLEVPQDISFAVEPGAFVALVGPSGCVKSTILNLLAGLIEPDAGAILVGGQPFSRHRHRVSYVFQKPRLLNWRTVRQNVEFALRADGVPRSDWDRRAQAVLALVGLEQFADEYPLTLSGGMQQRVAIARALAIEPQYLLIDEITARAQRRELLRFREKISATVIFVTHNALEAVYLADRVYVLSARPARIVAELPVEVSGQREMDDPALAAQQRAVLRALGVE